MRLRIMDVKWTKVEVLGVEGLFTKFRIDRNTIPEGLYFYEVRHDDWMCDEPVEIALGVLANFWGTLLTKEPLELEPMDGGNAYTYIDHEKDWKFLNEDYVLKRES